MKKNAVRDHLHRRKDQRLGAAITPNSRSSPGTHNKDFPESVGGREGRGSASALPPGDLFPRSTIASGYPVHSGRTGARPVFALLLLLLLLPAHGLRAQGAAPVDPASQKGVEPAAEGLPTVESIRPDEPVDLALETYLQRNRDDSSLFTPRGQDERPVLDGQELDSLNPHGKEGDITIPLRGYPAPDDPPRPEKPIYLEGAIGLNTTALLRAGFSGKSWPFNYHGQLDFSSSNGFVENGQESRLSATLGGGYVIGLNYGIFSGGYMGGEIGYDRASWNLYALDSPPARSLSGWHVEAESGAGIDRFDLRGKARLRTFSVEQTTPGPEPGTTVGEINSSIGMTSVEGELHAKTSTGSILWDGNLDLRLTEADGHSLNYGRFDLRTGIDFGIIRLRVGGSMGGAEGSDGESRSLLVPVGELRLAPFDGFTLAGRLSGGVYQTTPDRILEINRYATIDGPWLPESESRGYEVVLNVAPSTAWGFRGAASRRDFDTWMHFGQSVAGEFSPLYTGATIDRIDADFFLNITSRDRVAAVLAFTDAKDLEGSPIPYTPRWDGEIFYHRRLFNIPSTAGGSIRYIGKREGGSASLDPVLLVSLDWSYTIAGLFDAVLAARNLFGSSYQLWEGYEERGLFLSIGVRARL